VDDLRLDLWRETADGRATLINLSENHTFLVDAPAGRSVLRVHRPGYQTAETIESELSWLAALSRDTDLPVVRPLPGRDGRLLQQIGDRYAVLFAFEEGREPTSGSVPLFRTIGAFAAKAHLHVTSWQPPAGFTRPTWSAEAMLEPDGLWGDWRKAPGVGLVRETLDVLAARLHADLTAYGAGPDRFGLIHADMRLANLLVDGPRTTLLDFDDSGFGWFIYDLGSALSFIDLEPEAPALRAAWLEGYTSLRPLSAEDLAIIDAMVLLRRMVLLAWIGTHGETQLAKTHVRTFAADTARAGRAWLERR